MVTSVATEPGYLGPYRLLRVLGEGGMARIYLGEHGVLGKLVAIKVLRPPFADVPDARERFLREARIAATVRHPNLVEVTDFASDPQMGAYYVMELLAGETLAERIAHQGGLDATVTLDIAREVAGGLAALHAAGVVHRDVKADNVFLSRGRHGGAVKLIDFGVARWHPPVDRKRRCTIDGALIGTPEYMAPEQVGGEPVDERTDVWGFGALLFEMVTGRRPFAGARLRELLMSVVTEDPPPLSRVVPDGLEALVRQCLAKEPDQRPASMAAVAARLDAIRDAYEQRAAALDVAIDADSEHAYDEIDIYEEIDLDDELYEELEISPAVAPADDDTARPRRRLGAITAVVLLVLVILGGAVGLSASFWIADLEVEAVAPVPAAAD